MNGEFIGPSVFLRAVITKYHKLSGLNDRNLSYGSGGSLKA